MSAPTAIAARPLAQLGVQHVINIDLENESFGDTFGANSPATYLNKTLLPQGQLVQGFYGTGHVSLDNYLAQVSGQAPNNVTNNDCITNTTTLAGQFVDLTPGTPDPDQARYPGQADGQGCVMPASVQTIGDQLDARYPSATNPVWREYAQDMGTDPARDGGPPDPLGGTDCAHPTQVGGNAIDNTNSAQGPNGTGAHRTPISDQYATRHNPFMYFHSVIDNQRSCNTHVVPLGHVSVGVAGAPDTFSGHLAQDLASEATTPKFSFITPNLCSDGHDATCAGTNTEGGTTGGLTGADLWLKHWIPLIENSPAYRSGNTLIAITFDEGNPYLDQAAGDHEQPGPNTPYPGYSPLLSQLGAYTAKNVPLPSKPGDMPGGGQIGAVLLQPRLITPGSTNTTGSYNHYSALRSYEDLLGVTTGGADNHGHLGFAATATSFGTDVFNAPPNPSADLHIGLQTPLFARAGADITTTLTVHNAGPDAARPTQATLIVPAGYTVKKNDGGTLATGSVGGFDTFHTPFLPPGGTATFSAVLTAPAGSAVGLTAAYTYSPTHDPNLFNNIALALTFSR